MSEEDERDHRIEARAVGRVEVHRVFRVFRLRAFNQERPNAALAQAREESLDVRIVPCLIIHARSPPHISQSLRDKSFSDGLFLWVSGRHGVTSDGQAARTRSTAARRVAALRKMRCGKVRQVRQVAGRRGAAPHLTLP